MNKLLILAAAAAIGTAACGGASETSSNAANGSVKNNPVAAMNSNSNSNTNSLPPGVATGPAAPTSNSTPGIPAPGKANVDANSLRSNSKTAPPNPATALQKIKPGATPIPGIDPEKAKRQISGELPPVPSAPRTTITNTENRRRMRQGRPIRPAANDHP